MNIVDRCNLARLPEDELTQEPHRPEPFQTLVIRDGFVVKAIRDRSDEAVTELPHLGLWVHVATSFSKATRNVAVVLEHSFRDAPRFLPVLRWDMPLVDDFKLPEENVR